MGKKFSELGLNDGVMDGLNAMGFEEATPIQEAAIPIVIGGKDIIGVAQTGTGKTAAFLLPTMHKISESSEKKGVRALIIVPTRELALQIDQTIEGFAYFCGISSLPIYGGGDATSFEREKVALTSGTEIVVATPGRMISHLNLGYVDFGTIDYLILDEADRMLDMGFFTDIMRIIKHCNPNRQSLLFSATMPDKIGQLANNILNNPETIKIAVSKPAERVLQAAYSIFDDQRPDLLVSLLDNEDLRSVIVFSSTKKTVSELHKKLKKKGLNVGAISSDLDQNQREEVMLGFRNRKIKVLVATDVVSRGIDIDDIDLVINYDVPQDAEDYVHRVGRTARAAKSGMALTFITPNDQHKFYRIEQLIGSEVRKVPVPDEYGPSPKYSPSQKSNKGRHKKKFSGRKGKR